MQITKEQLKQIIKEEISTLLDEVDTTEKPTKENEHIIYVALQTLFKDDNPKRIKSAIGMAVADISVKFSGTPFEELEPLVIKQFEEINNHPNANRRILQLIPKVQSIFLSQLKDAMSGMWETINDS